jgi:hypothetical protein
MKILEFYKSKEEINLNSFKIQDFINSAEQPGNNWLVILAAKEIRSIKQNAYMWAALLTPIADYIGCKPEEIHEEFKIHFLGTETKQRYDITQRKLVPIEIPKSTTKLSPAAFTVYCNQIKDHAIQVIGVDFGFSDFDTFINQHPEIVEQYTQKYIYDKVA